MTRILKVVVLLALVVSTLLVLTPGPASAATCPVDQSICAALVKTFRPVLCQSKIFSCDRILQLFLTPQPEPEPNANCNDALRYADTPPTTERGLRWAEFAIVCLVNQERTNQGRVSLRIDARLTTAARNHAQDIVIHDPSDQHRGSDGSDIRTRVARTGYTATAVAENIYSLHGSDGTLQYRDESGQLRTCIGPNGRSDTTPRDVVIGWMCSPGHRNNILNGNLQDTGVGAVFGFSRGDDSQGTRPYPSVTYVQVFARPAS